MTNHGFAGPGDRPPAAERAREADSVRTHAGMGDQGLCPNGNADCGDPLPCFDCLVDGSDDGDREVATDGGQDAVYVTRGYRTSTPTVHTNPDCPYLARVGTWDEKAPENARGIDRCRWCAGEIDGPQGTTDLSGCPFCDGPVGKSLAAHLEACPEAPRERVLPDGGTVAAAIDRATGHDPDSETAIEEIKRKLWRASWGGEPDE